MESTSKYRLGWWSRIGVCMVSCLLAISCATNSGESTDENIAEESVSEVDELGDLDTGDAAAEGAELGDAALDSELGDIASNATEAAAPAADAAAATTGEGELLDENILLAPDAAKLGEEAPATPPTTPPAGDGLDNLEAAVAETPAPAAPVAAAPVEPPKEPPQATLAAPIPAPIAAMEPAPPRRARTASADRVPKIPGAAFKKKGANLNRFYFLRAGDTAESASQLMYGSPDRANDLMAWNGTDWAPGKLVYYSSPTQPEDQEMRSFYQERNVQPEEYQFKQGDWLSKVAGEKLGSPLSWKEIAVINGIASPKTLEAGAKIAIYPANLNQYAMQAGGNQPPAAQVAPPQVQPPPQAQAQAPVANPEVPVVTQDPMAQAQPEGTAAVPPEDGTGDEANPFDKKKKGGGLNVSRLIEQNLFAIVIGGGVLVLGLLLVMMAGKNKKKKASLGDDFGDDAFNNPKAKRK